ncbi:acyl carrier protein [Luteolibacter ambystomatis]|uniref:Acyl carrier protein n=1 Tax=Luteolibacter ambystomatis TaxID=2824561 RepID=A0A975IZT1_9BACT|nr:acyl carrier protein [Luteolibacter ambystomatis]QUE51388.1 acyl carrier protein [Luteolibacter ambystomatis]
MSTPTLGTETVRTLIADQFGLDPAELADDTPMFSSGLLDSFHLVELISVLEKTSGRRIKPGEINLENLDSPQRIANFLGASAS